MDRGHVQACALVACGCDTSAVCHAVSHVLRATPYLLPLRCILLLLLAGTYAYVTAGHVGKAVLTEGEGSFGVESWQVAVALGATVLALGFVGRLAKNAVEEADREALEEQRQKEQQQKQKQQAAASTAAAEEPAATAVSAAGESGSSGSS